jgi:hypothetical protein
MGGMDSAASQELSLMSESGLIWTPKRLPEPNPESAATPEFKAVWDCIRSWDVLCTKGHVQAILNALEAAKSKPEPEQPKNYRGGFISLGARVIESGECVRVNADGRIGVVFEILEGNYVFCYWVKFYPFDGEAERFETDAITPLVNP